MASAVLDYKQLPMPTLCEHATESVDSKCFCEVQKLWTNCREQSCGELAHCTLAPNDNSEQAVRRRLEYLRGETSK